MNFLGTQKRVRISHGKRVIGVRIIEVLLYTVCTLCKKNTVLMSRAKFDGLIFEINKCFEKNSERLYL